MALKHSSDLCTLTMFFLLFSQGAESLSQLRKLAQNYPTQEGVGNLGDIDEDDEVPGMLAGQ